MKLTPFKNKGITVFSTADARKAGISPQVLRYHLQRGTIERVSHGVYRFPEATSFDLETLILENLKAIPQGVIGLKTVLRLYGLTEENPARIDIIVPDNNIPKRKLPDVRLVPVTSRLYRTDVSMLRKIPVTSLERTFVDLLRHDIPLSFVLGVFHEAQRKRLPLSFPKLKRLAVMFRAKAKVQNFIEAVL